MFKSVFILLFLCLSFCVQADIVQQTHGEHNVKIIYEKKSGIKIQPFLSEIKEEFNQLKNDENKFKQALADDLKSAAASAFALAKIKENSPEAETYYKQAIQLDPEAIKVELKEAKLTNENQQSSLQAKKVLSQSENNEKQLKQALTNSLEKAASDAFALAKIKDLQSNSSAAKTYFERAIQLAPENPLYLSEFGSYLANLGENSEAKSLLQRSLAIYEKSLGKNHPTTKSIKANLEGMSRGK